jgi:isoquinoline 1-oxidoreductase subunit alpha
MQKFRLNGVEVEIPAAKSNAPLLWFIREHVKLTGTKFGCGQGLCGCCTVHFDGAAIRACITPLYVVAGHDVTTIEGLSPDTSHPVQRAWLEEQVPQCGYCQSGQIMQAAAFLAGNRKPTDAEIVAAMSGNLCRCGTYQRIRRAVKRASEMG